MVILVEILEDGLAKALDAAHHVPRAIVVNLLHDIAQNPLQHQVSSLQVLYDFIYRLGFHLLIVQLHPQAGSQFQFTGQVTQHTLEEGVNGGNAEVAVVVQQVVKG